MPGHPHNQFIAQRGSYAMPTACSAHLPHPVRFPHPDATPDATPDVNSPDAYSRQSPARSYAHAACWFGTHQRQGRHVTAHAELQALPYSYRAADRHVTAHTELQSLPHSYRNTSAGNRATCGYRQRHGGRFTGDGDHRASDCHV